MSYADHLDNLSPAVPPDHRAFIRDVVNAAQALRAMIEGNLKLPALARDLAAEHLDRAVVSLACYFRDFRDQSSTTSPDFHEKTPENQGETSQETLILNQPADDPLSECRRLGCAAPAGVAHSHVYSKVGNGLIFRGFIPAVDAPDWRDHVHPIGPDAPAATTAPDDGHNCGICHQCLDAADAELPLPLRRTQNTFITCPECGNKRCPRAEFHGNACTGSNEPGQIAGDGPAYRVSITAGAAFGAINRANGLTEPCDREGCPLRGRNAPHVHVEIDGHVFALPAMGRAIKDREIGNAAAGIIDAVMIATGEALANAADRISKDDPNDVLLLSQWPSAALAQGLRQSAAEIIQRGLAGDLS